MVDIISYYISESEKMQCGFLVKLSKFTISKDLLYVSIIFKN